jgi:hypothetical protein
MTIFFSLASLIDLLANIKNMTRVAITKAVCLVSVATPNEIPDKNNKCDPF